jgi:hypothetical protein
MACCLWRRLRHWVPLDFILTCGVCAVWIRTDADRAPWNCHVLQNHNTCWDKVLQLSPLSTLSCDYRQETVPNFPHSATAPSGPGPPHYRGFTITLRHNTLGRTSLDEWSASRRDHYLTTHTTYKRQTDIHAPGGIRTPNASKRAVADPRLRPRSHGNQLETVLLPFVCLSYFSKGNYLIGKQLGVLRSLLQAIISTTLRQTLDPLLRCGKPFDSHSGHITVPSTVPTIDTQMVLAPWC